MPWSIFEVVGMVKSLVVNRVSTSLDFIIDKNWGVVDIVVNITIEDTIILLVLTNT